MECLCMAHLINCFVHGLDDCRCNWLCNITDTKTDDLFVRVCLLICIYLLSDGTEQLAAWQLLIVLIYMKHFCSSLSIAFL